MEIVAICTVLVVFAGICVFIEVQRRKALKKADEERIKRTVLETQTSRLQEEKRALSIEIEDHLDRLNQLVHERDQLRRKLGTGNTGGSNGGSDSGGNVSER